MPESARTDFQNTTISIYDYNDNPPTFSDRKNRRTLKAKLNRKLLFMALFTTA